MRYIGGKTLMLNNISNVLKENCSDIHSILDVFSGSCAVATHFIKLKLNVITNDFLYFSYVIARGTLGLKNFPIFSGLKGIEPFDFLNEITLDKTPFALEDCFIYNNYSPNINSQRMYFQNDNAIKIDLIRMQIELWKNEGAISEDEYFYLLAILLQAVPYVANITGTFGAYLKYWDNRTFNKLKLQPLPINLTDKPAKCMNRDYSEALSEETDVLYADPPYNSREYLPNYHLLETIAKYDNPQISGVTGMREYQNQKSPFCKKNAVATAFDNLLNLAKSKYIIISYNNEGLLSTDFLCRLCRQYAVKDTFRLYEYDYRRYKNKIPNNTQGLKEQLYFLRRR